MRNDFIKNLLDLKGVIVKKVRYKKNFVKIHIELPVREQTCPHCKAKTTKIKDYRTQIIKDVPMRFKTTLLSYRKRRYQCKQCGKTFYEKAYFLPKRARKTTRVTEFIVDRLKTKQSMKDIAKDADVSVNTVSRLLPLLAVSAKHLPEVLCIDEFKGNTYFPNAKVVADKFHFVRYATEAVDIVRKQVQKRLPRGERKYFKHSRKLLLSKYENLKTEKQKEELNYILINYSENLRIAYREKEEMLKIIQMETKEEAIEKLNTWIKRNLESDIPSLKSCAKTYLNWVTEIRNALKVPYSNGPMEGFNNKIKTLKRVAFGFRNFTHFKARILLMAN